jgi:hypothetical protein
LCEALALEKHNQLKDSEEVGQTWRDGGGGGGEVHLGK